MSVRAAVVQFDPRLGEKARNLERILRAVAETKAAFVVFPECALSGYGYDSKQEAMAVAETVPGPSTERIQTACRKSGTFAVVGLLERQGETLFNSAAIVGPDRIRSAYRKMHLPLLGVDRFTTPGDRGFPVFDLPFGRLGLLICYDLGFPEAARVLKLAGAQTICVPTNWPERAEVSCDHMPFARAQENHVNIVTANRIGVEAGFRFIGRSRIVGHDGRARAEAGGDETTLAADLDFEGADRNRVVNVPGKYEVDRVGHRRPEWYRPLAGL